MKERPMREREYLLAPLISCAREDKERKKATRRLNIQRGSKSSRFDLCIAYTCASLTYKIQWKFSKKAATSSKWTCSPVQSTQPTDPKPLLSFPL